MLAGRPIVGRHKPTLLTVLQYTPIRQSLFDHLTNSPKALLHLLITLDRCACNLQEVMDDLCLLVVRQRCFVPPNEHFSITRKDWLLGNARLLHDKSRVSQTYTIYRSLLNARGLRISHERLYGALETSFVEGYRDLLNSDAASDAAGTDGRAEALSCRAATSRTAESLTGAVPTSDGPHVVGFVFTSSLPADELALSLQHKISGFKVVSFYYGDVTVCVRRKPSARQVGLRDKRRGGHSVGAERHHGPNEPVLTYDWAQQHPARVLTKRAASATFVRHIRSALLPCKPKHVHVNCSGKTFAVTVDNGVYIFNVRVQVLRADDDEQPRGNASCSRDCMEIYNNTGDCTSNPFDVKRLHCSMLGAHMLLTGGLELTVQRCMWRFYMLNDHEQQLRNLGIPDRPIRLALINWLHTNDQHFGTLSDLTIQRLVETLLYEMQRRNNNLPFYDFYTLNRPSDQLIPPKQDFVIHTDENSFRALQRCMIMHQPRQISHLFPTSSSSVSTRLVLDDDLEIIGGTKENGHGGDHGDQHDDGDGSAYNYSMYNN